MIDILRGLAAMTILVWHYQHFQSPTGTAGQPFFTLLRPLYEYGNWAVNLFWVISGFVFFAVYKAENLTISPFSFFIRRFSRLYPLHFTTLLLVAGLQFASFRLLGEHQIYQNNDLYHFLLNLFLASNWGFERGYSFNAPIWSVSVEEVVYAVFLLYCRFIPIRARTVAFMFAAAWGLFLLTGHLIATCALLFYLGGGLYLLWNRLSGRPWASVGLATLWLVGSIGLGWVAPRFGIIPRHVQMLYYVSVFPALVFLAACLEAIVSKKVVARFVWIGDITYSIYLIHVPVQIVVLLILKTQHIGFAIADHGWFFLGYFAVVIGLGLLSYHGLERPAQRYLRERFLRLSPRRHKPATAPLTAVRSGEQT